MLKWTPDEAAIDEYARLRIVELQPQMQAFLAVCPEYLRKKSKASTIQTRAQRMEHRPEVAMRRQHYLQEVQQQRHAELLVAIEGKEPDDPEVERKIKELHNAYGQQARRGKLNISKSSGARKLLLGATQEAVRCITDRARASPAKCYQMLGKPVELLEALPMGERQLIRQVKTTKEGDKLIIREMSTRDPLDAAQLAVRLAFMFYQADVEKQSSNMSSATAETVPETEGIIEVGYELKEKQEEQCSSDE